MLNPKKSSFMPIRSKDLTAARYFLGLSNMELRNMLGGTAKTIAQGKNNEQVIPPSLAILVRMLWNNPEDAAMQATPSFDSLREALGEAFNKVVDRPNSRSRDGSIPKTIAAVLTGNRRAGGSYWDESNEEKYREPQPQTRRLFWLLNEWINLVGPEETMRRWYRAASEEALARGKKLDDVIESGSWPRAEGERGTSTSDDED
jgi:hypothetical protein